MNCVKCGCEKTSVYDTAQSAGFTYRRRVCSNCGRVFVTKEIEYPSGIQAFNEKWKRYKLKQKLKNQEEKSNDTN